MTTLTINGRAVETTADDLTPLVVLLRDELRLTGTKLGCGEGRCGACTVLVDGTPTMSCLTPIGAIAGRDVRSVEGLADPDGPLTPVQEAMVACGAVQCGACTPGVVMTLTALVADGGEPSEDAIRRALTGNICRCTGYHKIIDAALVALAGEGV